MVNLVDIKKLAKHLWETGRKEEFTNTPTATKLGKRTECNSSTMCDDCKGPTRTDSPKKRRTDRLSQVKRECIRCGKEASHWCDDHLTDEFLCDECLAKAKP